VQWGSQTTDVGKRWAELGVNPSGPVLFAYACVAGAADKKVIEPGTDIEIENWPEDLGQPWYVIKARADLSASGGTETVFVGTSFTTQLFSANVGD